GTYGIQSPQNTPISFPSRGTVVLRKCVPSGWRPCRINRRNKCCEVLHRHSQRRLSHRRPHPLRSWTVLGGQGFDFSDSIFLRKLLQFEQLLCQPLFLSAVAEGLVFARFL